MKVSLMSTIITTQVLLWLSYYIFFKTTRTDLRNLWGEVPGQLHTPLLGFATISYIINIWLLIDLARTNDLSREDETIIITCVLLYYISQLLFLPMADKVANNRMSKTYMQSLLIFCVIPFIVISGVVIRSSVQKNKKNRVFHIFASILPLLHVLIDDAILYGFLF